MADAMSRHRSDPDLVGQEVIDDEMAEVAAASARGGAGETQPRLDYPPYRSSLLRHPTKDLQHADPEAVELWATVGGKMAQLCRVPGHVTCHDTVFC